MCRGELHALASPKKNGREREEAADHAAAVAKRGGFSTVAQIVAKVLNGLLILGFVGQH